MLALVQAVEQQTRTGAAEGRDHRSHVAVAPIKAVLPAGPRVLTLRQADHVQHPGGQALRWLWDPSQTGPDQQCQKAEAELAGNRGGHEFSAQRQRD